MGSGLSANTPTAVSTHVEDVLRLIRAQNVDGDLLAVGEADVQSDFFRGNLLRLLREERSGKSAQEASQPPPQNKNYKKKHQIATCRTSTKQ